jgi:hypothetical protein
MTAWSRGTNSPGSILTIGVESRVSAPSATKRAKLAVEAGREHPAKHFYSFEQWVEVLGGLIARYNDEKREGRILDGSSPNQAFEEFWPHDNPPVKFDAACWHLCAHYVRECDVKAGGISFDFGKDQFTYCDTALAAYRHRRVLAWFDPGHPEVLGVTDLDQKNPFFVQRSNPVDFLATLDPDSAEAEHYCAEVSKQQGFNKHARAVFRSVKPEFNRTYRPNIVARPTAALGQEMLAKRNEALEQQDDGSRRRERILRLCRQLGESPDTLRDFSEQTEKVLKRRLKRRESPGGDAKHTSASPLNGERTGVRGETVNIDEREPASAGKKTTYVLNSAPGSTGSRERSYLDYLIGRLTEFRQAGASFGQKFSGTVTTAATAKIVARQLGASVGELVASRFPEAVEYLQAKIDATILGKRNLSKGVANYHSFADDVDKATL